ncbi:maestro heat-like repeat-containing protein family member 2B [Lagopus muta]|uniref:maestro heat-like repeat-containing protein family member 2B n=1 Tax=Lagopus muta TaxID=64668 RepID=UPI0020A030C4|nr:maestro heat-like repeat-containing protein family member 2B [Lagopus muta]
MHQPCALLRSATRAPQAGPCVQEGEALCTALFLSPPCPLSIPRGKRFCFQKHDFHFLSVLFPAKVTNGVIEMGDIGSQCEGLNDCSTIAQLQTSSKIARVVCSNFPLEQTVDFMTAIKDTFRKARGMRVRAAGKWLITFLQMYGKDICRDALMILYILRSCTSSAQQSTFMPFLCQAVVILTRCHKEVMIDNFSRLPKATDSETWRRIREFCLQRWGR